MSHIYAYNSVNGSRPYDPLRNDAMLNPHTYGMSSYSDSGFNSMLGAQADRLYYCNTSYSNSASSNSRTSSGKMEVRSGQFCSYGLWH
jgi:hypothetical protein